MSPSWSYFISSLSFYSPSGYFYLEVQITVHRTEERSGYLLYHYLTHNTRENSITQWSCLHFKLISRHFNRWRLIQWMLLLLKKHDKEKTTTFTRRHPKHRVIGPTGMKTNRWKAHLSLVHYNHTDCWSNCYCYFSLTFYYPILFLSCFGRQYPITWD